MPVFRLPLGLIRFHSKELFLISRLILFASLGLFMHSSAFAIDAKYRSMLERSGCTQMSEMQGCDIHKSKAENAKAGFVTPAPTFDCKKAQGDIENLICADPDFGALDRTLAVVYAAALRKAINEHPPVLKAEQRGWVKGRNDCWKAEDRQKCVSESYRLRIAELQARYRLIPVSANATFYCDGNPRNVVIVDFFQTDPPSLIAERGDSVSLMYQQPAASGTRYQGRNDSFWEHQGMATVVLGYGAPEMRCKKQTKDKPVSLAGSTWELIAIQSMDDAQGKTPIDHPERFTVSFATDGRASFRIDCNRGTANWKATPSAESSSGALEFGPLATTKMMCPPGSVDQKVLRDLAYVRSYLLKDGKLFLSLMADGGIYEWRPSGKQSSIRDFQ